MDPIATPNRSLLTDARVFNYAYHASDAAHDDPADTWYVLVYRREGNGAGELVWQSLGEH